ncbi:MAG: hypothetical protein WDM88_13250 [Galbitalea sp.]
MLSGLHAHIVLFMSMATPGQTVLLLPVEAGGHVSGRAILERLGLTVVEMAVNVTDMSVDIERTLEISADVRPDYVLVDRSEGLVFEDFSRLGAIPGAVSIFDASQYLTNIIAGDHPNPLDAGFDLIVASVHKNFPGPQKAILATRQKDETWKRILAGVSTFVSSMHIASTYAAGLTLARTEWLSEYRGRCSTSPCYLRSISPNLTCRWFRDERTSRRPTTSGFKDRPGRTPSSRMNDLRAPAS